MKSIAIAMLLGVVTPSSHIPCNSIFGPDCTATDGEGGKCMQKTLVNITDPQDNDYLHQLNANAKLVVGYVDLVPKCESKVFQDKIALKGNQYTDDMTTMVWEYKAIDPQYTTPENPLKGMLEMIANGQKAFDHDVNPYFIDPRDPGVFDREKQESMSVEDKLRLLITLERENLAIKDQTELEKQILASSAANIDILKAGMQKGEADADVKKKELALLEQTKKQSMALLEQLSDAVLKAETDSKAQTFIKEMATKTPEDIKTQIETSARQIETAAEEELKNEIKKIDETVNKDSGANAFALAAAATVTASMTLF